MATKRLPGSGFRPGPRPDCARRSHWPRAALVPAGLAPPSPLSTSAARTPAATSAARPPAGRWGDGPPHSRACARYTVAPPPPRRRPPGRFPHSQRTLAHTPRTLRGKFHTPEADIAAYVRQIGRVAEIVRPNRVVRVLRDEADNRVLACAETGRVDLVVSGDRDLLRLKQHGSILIVRPADFVRTLGPSHSGEIG